MDTKKFFSLGQKKTLGRLGGGDNHKDFAPFLAQTSVPTQKPQKKRKDFSPNHCSLAWNVENVFEDLFLIKTLCNFDVVIIFPGRE